jgi:hypothetical protein
MLRMLNVNRYPAGETEATQIVSGRRNLPSETLCTRLTLPRHAERLHEPTDRHRAALAGISGSRLEFDSKTDGGKSSVPGKPYVH